jgi:hypothetical protein
MTASFPKSSQQPDMTDAEQKHLNTHYTFVTWKWKQDDFRSRYIADHVNVMASMLHRFVEAPHRVICVTDDPDNVKVETFPLWDDHSKLRNVSGHHLPSCYRRLKLFDEKTQQDLGIAKGGRIVSIDLDTVVLDKMKPLLMRDQMFVGWAVPGTRHNKVFNGSMWMFTAGDELQWMWDTFKPDQSPQRALQAGFYGSDQGYISHQLVYSQLCGNWTAQDGVLSYARDIRGPRILPKHARVVMFHGKRKPWDANVKKESKWIERYWKVENDATPA